MDPAAAARQAVVDARAGGFFYAHLVGVRGYVPEPGQAHLTAADDGALSAMPVATLADVALGTALRSALAPGRLLVTTTLTLSLARRPAGPLEATGSAVHVGPGPAVATCLLRDAAGAFGVATGSFVAPPTDGAGYPVTPWEHPELPPQRPLDEVGDTMPAEQEALDAVAAAAQRASRDGGSVSDGLLGLCTREVSDDACVVTSRPAAALANRAGTVHGGALSALAVAAARPLLDDAAWEVREASVHFLRPGTLSPGGAAELTASCRLRRRGRRSAVADVTVAGAAGTVVLALLRFGEAPR